MRLFSGVVLTIVGILTTPLPPALGQGLPLLEPMRISPPDALPAPTSGTTAQSGLHSNPDRQRLLAEIVQLQQEASLLYLQGQYAAAIPLFERVLTLQEQALGANHLEMATTLKVLAGLYLFQKDYGQVEASLQRALSIQEQTLGPDHLDLVSTLGGLSGLYLLQGKFSAIEPLLQRTLALQEQGLGPNHLDVANTLNSLAVLYTFQVKLPAAESFLKRALTIQETALNPDHPEIAQTLINLGNLYQVQGNFVEAKPLYQRALTIQENAETTDPLEVAKTLNALAGLQQVLGNFKEADSLYHRALKVIEPEQGFLHQLVRVAILKSLGDLYLLQGTYAASEQFYRQALTLMEDKLELNQSLLAGIYSSLGLLDLIQGNLTEAEPQLQRALTLQEQLLGPNHPFVGISLFNLAWLYGVQGNIDQATEMSTRATQIEEQNLSLILATGSEARKRALMEILYQTTDGNVFFHLQVAPNNLQTARLALTTVLQRKGRVLDVLTESLQALRQNLTPADQALMDQLNTVRSQLATLTFRGPEGLSGDQYRASLLALQTQAETLENTLARRSADFRQQSQPIAMAVGVARPLDVGRSETIAAVQQHIPQDAALVELVLYKPFNPKATRWEDRFAAPHYAAYILHAQGDPQWVDLGDAAEIEEAVFAFRQQLSPGAFEVKKTARRLDQLLMQPIRQKLGQTRQILLSPDSTLNLIPFAALVDENNQYLVETYTITYLTTGRDLLRLAHPAESRQAPILLANPLYDQPGKPQDLMASRARDPHRQRSVDLTTLTFEPLPGTAAEGQAIATLLPTMRVLTAAAATENALKQVRGPKLLHIATHGFFLGAELKPSLPQAAGLINAVRLQGGGGDPQALHPVMTENPLLRSGIALAGFNLRQSGSEDGVLTALEAAGLDLRGTQLVVLSACETGVGDITQGEGVYGLRRALAIAGAESQLLSLWNVGDEATKDLMVAYYQRLLKQAGRSEALRQTQLEMLHGDQYQHPYFWAAFIPSGAWTPLKF